MLEYPSAQKVRVVQELVQGQEFATQLQLRLHEPSLKQDGSVSVEELVEKILRSFTESLSVVRSSELGQKLQQQADSSGHDWLCADGRPSTDDSGDNRKRQAATKDRRGCYKRKKNTKTWTVVSASLEDGHAWRKYGQKDILNAKYPRSYFRCTHKYDQDCKATKQVQKLEHDPQQYQTTYIGNHTCIDTYKNMSADSDSWASYVVSNSSDSHTPVSNHHHLPAFSLTSMKQEESKASDEQVMDSTMWLDLMPLDSADQPVYSCSEVSSHTHCLPMDFVVSSVDFDPAAFHFDHSDDFYKH